MINPITLADTAQKGSGLIMIGYILIILLVMYFLMIRPQKKKQKEEKKMRDSLQVGDEIITIGGIHGRVISIKDDSLIIESVCDHCKLTIERWAMQSNLTVHEESPVK